jgi:hypothetical protein
MATVPTGPIVPTAPNTTNPPLNLPSNVPTTMQTKSADLGTTFSTIIGVLLIGASIVVMVLKQKET